MTDAHEVRSILEEVERRFSDDPGFRARVLADPESALRQAGVTMTAADYVAAVGGPTYEVQGFEPSHTCPFTWCTFTYTSGVHCCP